MFSRLSIVLSDHEHPCTRARTWDELPVELDVDDVDARVVRHERDEEDAFARHLDGVGHGAAVHHDLELPLSGLRHVDCGKTQLESCFTDFAVGAQTLNSAGTQRTALTKRKRPEPISSAMGKQTRPFSNTNEKTEHGVRVRGGWTHSRTRRAVRSCRSRCPTRGSTTGRSTWQCRGCGRQRPPRTARRSGGCLATRQTEQVTWYCTLTQAR